MKPIKHIAALAAAALMAGCGGGGNTPATETASLTVQGDVIKGAMANAKVSLYKPTAEGKRGDLLEKTTTDINGHYSATVNGYSGVMIMEASVVPGETSMYDEATKKIIFPAADFIMRASFSAEAGKDNQAQINPFTDLATAMALAKVGGLSTTNVTQANKDLAESLTFDPLTSKPEFDATTKAPTNPAAALLAAVSRMAESGELGCSAGEQVAKVACVTQALSEKGLADAGVKSSLQTYTNAIAFEAGLPAVTFGNPSGTAPSTASAVEQTKAFFGTLRSNAKALDATDLSLQTELQAVSKDMTGRTIPLASTSLDALNLARLGVQFMNDVIENAVVVTNGTATKNFGSRGSCDYYNTPQKYVACTNLDGYKVTLLTDGTNTFTMSTSKVSTQTTQITTILNAILPVATLTTTRTRAGATVGPVTAVTLVGELSSIDADFKYKVDLSAALSKVGDLDNLAVSGSIDLINSGTLASIERIELAAGSYLQAKLDQGSYSAQDGSQEMLLKLKASTAASAVTGDLKLSAFMLDASKTSYIPTLVSFAGSVQRNGVSFFEGTLTGEALNHAAFNSSLPRSATNVQKMRVGFTGKVDIPTRPALNVNLSVVNNDTGNRATNTATLGGQYSQGAIVINLDGKTSAASNILTLTSSEGIKLVIDPLAVTHPLTKSGVLLGNFSTSNSRIDYTDNSYEQY